MPQAAFNLAALFLIALTVVAPLESAFAQTADATATASSVPAVSNEPVPDSASAGTSATPPTSGSAPAPSVSPAPPAPAAVQPATPSADSAPAAADTTLNQPTSPSTPSSNTQSSPNTPNAAKPAAQGAALFSQGSGSPGPGSVANSFFNQNQFKIDENTGAARVTYPITIPPGRNQVQPNLDLVYNSQNSQLGSIFGEGWSIGIPYIERFNRTGVDAFYATSSQKYFASSMDGELSTTTTSGSYIARTDTGTFNKYTFSSNEWTMIDKNGTQYLFGSTSDSQQSDPVNASDTYKWMLKQETDTNGNSVLYNYFNDSGQIYPSSTIYTNTSSTNGIFEVDFLRSSSADNATSSFTGFPVRSNYRISEIDTTVNGTWARKYNLSYTTGDNGSTTLLSSIAETGENASGTVVTMPSSTFSYRTQSPGWVSNSIWNPLISFTASSSADDGVRVADVNGDGLPDIVQGYSDSNGSTTYAAYINNGADWTVSSTWNPPLAFVSSTVDMGVRIADVNGDGLPDILQGYEDSGGTSHLAAYINTGDGWAASSTWNPPIVFASSTSDMGVRIVDVNGDGLPDLIQAYSDSAGTTHYAAYINNGSGWTSNSAWDSAALFIATSSIDIGARFADVNGDGLPDIIQAYTDASSTSHYAAYLNTGNGFSASSTSAWNPPVVFANNGVDTGARIMDVNGDGLPDIIQAYTDSGGTAHYAAYLNTGNGWAADSAWNPSVTFTLNGTDNGTRIVDVNGDGLPDIIQAYTDSGGVEHVSAYTNNNKFRADLLTGVTYPQGGASTLSYQSILQITDPLGNVLNGVPYPVYIVSQIGNNDGFGNAASSTYVYQGGTYYTNGPFDHEFAGFTSVTKTDPAGNATKTYYDTSNGNSTSTGQYQDNFWKIGEPYRVENYDSSNNLYRVLVNRWDSYGLGGEAGFVKLASTTQLDYDGLSTHADKAESYTYDNTTGNLTEKIQWGEVVAAADGTFTDTSTDKLTTDYSYASSVGSNATGKISDETLSNQSSTKMQETRYYYDNLGLGSIGAGNLTKQEDWKSGTTYITTTQNTYNGYGLVTESLDPRSKATDYSYDTYNLYPATSTNALSQSTGYHYDYSSGQVTQTTDPNGSIFKTAYDGFGRTLEATQPDPSATSTQQVKTDYTYTDTSGAASVHKSDYLSGAAGAVELYGTSLYSDSNLADYYRLEGNSNDAKGANNGTDSNISYSTSYGKFGEGASFNGTNSTIITGSNSGISGSAARSISLWFYCATTTADTALAGYGNYQVGGAGWTLFANISAAGTGALGVNVAGPGSVYTSAGAFSNNTWNHVVITYSGGSLSSGVKIYLNGVSQTLSVSNDTTPNTQNTPIYIGVGHANSNFGYYQGSLDDVAFFNRALTSDEVSNLYSGGPGLSVDTYTYYDGLGRVIQTRVSSETSTIYKVTDESYNPLGLVQKQSLPYFANGISRTAATSTSALFTTYTYDPLLRPLTATNSVGTTSYSYANWKTTVTDARGKPKDQYDDAYGNLAQVNEHSSGSTYSTYYAYDGLKDLTKLTDALGNVRNFTYDGLGRELTAQDLHVATDTTYGTWNYTYDDAGNLTQKVNPNNQTSTYAYDDLNRVTSESYGGQTQISYTYDTCTYGVGRLCVASSSDAVTSKTYDALGQLAQESKTISSSTYTTSYTYDRQGHQLTITNPDSSKIEYSYNTAGLVESVSEQESGGSLTTIISDFDYAPTDQVARETYANGMVAKNIYDPLHLYRLVGKVTANISGGGGAQQLVRKLGGGGLLTPGGGGGGGLITTSTVIFSYTGTVASFTIPSDVYNLAITLDGAQGAASSSNRAVGGKGGQTNFTVGVASGTTYWYYLGGQGGNGVNGGEMSWFAATSTLATSTVWAIAAGGGAGGTKVVPGGCGSTDGGAGGGGGGTSGSAGSSGVSNPYGHAGGGGGGTQSAGGTAGAGGTGYNGNNGSNGTAATSTAGAPGGGGYSCSGNGGGGGSGYFGGGGGGGGGGGSLSSNNQGGGGGGGGTSFILATSTFSNTSTVAGVNVGNGSLTIVETHQVYAPTISSLSQFLSDATTTLSRGSSTSQTSVVLGAMLNSSGTENLQFQLEAEPMGKNFTDIPNVTSSAFMTPNSFATSSFYGASGVSYHWQARAVDALGNPSDWERFSSSTYTTDFTFKYNYVISTSTYTGSVGTYTVPDGVTKLVVTVDGAQGGSSGGLGGEASGTLPVTPGATYYYSVGQKGGNGSNNNVNPNSGGGGGGMTWFSTQATFATSTALLVGGGGGGAGGAWEASSGGSISGGAGGYGGGGAGGSTNGTSPGAGGGGGGLYGGNGGTSTGGSGGSQSSGYGVGQGGAGQSNVGVSGPGCTGGAGGGTTGANGSTCTNGSGWQGTGGGGGGSGYASTNASLTATGTASGVHSGDGLITIEGLIAPTLTLVSSTQYYYDGTTPLAEGYSTNGGKVVFGGTLDSQSTSSVQLQVEVEPLGFVSTSSKELYDNSLYGDANLNSYYRLEGNSNDWKGSNNGSDQGMAYGDNFGLFGEGASFNGSSSKIVSQNNSGISGSAARSISLWFYCATTTADTALAGYGNYQTGGAGWTLFANISAGGTGALGVNVAGPGSVYTSAGAFSNNTWNHVVITYSGGSLSSGVKIYVNGVSKSLSVANNTTPSTQNTPIYIGAAHANTDFGYYQGYVDDVAFFNRALSATEVQNLYNGSAGGFANLANTSSSALVSPGTFATSSFSGTTGSYHWQARVVDPANNGASAWQLFGPTSTSTDFNLSPLLFTYPTPAATTSSTFNWQLNATNVTSTNSYQVKVAWGISAPNEASSSVNASGTQLESGVSFSKTLYSGDYSDTGDPVNMSALGTLYDITGTSTLIATTSVSFTENTIAAAANCNSSDIQCISYNYDANGNIISIVDNSTSSAARTVNYTYDDLNRLTMASSSNVVSGSNYSQTFSYDALGNISSGPAGSYSYQGNQGPSYADPDAATSITLGTSTTNFAYDNDGNLLTTGNATDTWNYRDQMTQTITGSGSSTYAYDYTGARVKLRENATTTVFASNTYNVTLGASTTVKSIFANGALIATVEGASSTIYYDLTDHLGGLNLVEATSGAGVETLDYYPYGQARIDIKGGSYSGERRKYIGQEYDAASQLQYLNARYYDGARGQFVSQDPAFIGDPHSQRVGDPQSLNAYSYSENNPITKSDPTGKCLEDLCIGETALVVAAVETAPEWGPVLSEEASSIVSEFSGMNFPVEPPTNLTASTEQVINGPLENYYLDGGNRFGDWVDWFRDNTWKGVKIIGGLAGTACAFTDCTSIFEQQRSPSVSVGNSGTNGSNLYWTQPPSSNSAAGNRNAQPIIEATGRSSPNSHVLTPQQAQNIQSQINQIQNAIKNIENVINSLSSGNG